MVNITDRNIPEKTFASLFKSNDTNKVTEPLKELMNIISNNDDEKKKKKII